MIIPMTDTVAYSLQFIEKCLFLCNKLVHSQWDIGTTLHADLPAREQNTVVKLENAFYMIAVCIYWDKTGGSKMDCITSFKLNR